MSECKHEWVKKWVVTKKKAENVNEGGCVPGSQDMITVKVTRRKVCNLCGKRKYTFFPFMRRSKTYKQLLPFETKGKETLKRASKQPGVF
jgi:hypothetical protein